MRSRTENVGAVLARLATVMEQRTTDEWLELMRKAEIPATPIASPSDLLHDPHLEAPGFWEERVTDQGNLRFRGIPTSFSEQPGPIGDPGPSLGQAGRAVRVENGFTEAEIESPLVSTARLPGEEGNQG